ncbi:sulfotransferase family protein [Aspergillus melleus]|uniref:sulfotransferase family protein n=1 Tax=Aspergillus melleus TaxID=138277 RepID=UPI001E8DB194|nr:uncharacterized protein LDX57_006741 [Aspergillus melleus]KAH8429071.1 hypothetical protein LDX57_006741 [Aspergillus melleus]
MAHYDNKINPSPLRTKPMKVLVLGLPRTGTTSLYSALNHLGYKTYHYAEILKPQNNHHFTLWLRALDSKYSSTPDSPPIPLSKSKSKPSFEEILAPYNAAVADPCCFFVPELLTAYPEAKIILTTRKDAESWLRSMQSFLLPILSWPSWPLLSYFDPHFSGPYYRFLSRTMSILSQGRVPYSPEAGPVLVESYRRHNESVRRLVPEGRLLEFRAEMGWGPLCGFLGCEVPKEREFPCLNQVGEAVWKEDRQYWVR